MANAESWLALPQGRRTKYAVWGEPEGVPVIHCHGSPGSRLERYPDAGLTAALGVRFITLDRPGYGYGTPVERPVAESADDVAALADHLGLDSFYLHGFSGGAAHVLAVASRFPQRVRGAAVLAGLGPLDRPGSFDGMWADSVVEWRIAREAPDRLAAHLTAQVGRSSLPDAELETLLAQPALLDMMLEGAPESIRQGQAGVICDDLALVRPWGFALSAVTTRLHLWHGERDTLVPFHHAEFLAAQVRDATVHRCVGKGHFDLFALQEDVLGTLLDPGEVARTPPSPTCGAGVAAG